MTERPAPFRFAVSLVALAALSTPFASALSSGAVANCSAQARSLKAQQTATTELQAKRDALAADVEVAGEEWDAAEATRLFGDAETAKANEAKAAYEALKADFVTVEAELHDKAAKLNAGVAAFNETCATE